MLEDKVFLARNYFDRGDYLGSIRLLEESELVLENQEHLEPLLLLAESYIDLNRDDEGIDLMKELLSAYPDNSEVKDKAIQLFSRFRDLAEESKALTIEQRLTDPESSYYSYILAYLGFHWLSSPKSEVLSHLREALGADYQGTYLDFAYDVYRRFDMHDECEEIVERMLADSPDAHDSRRCLILQKLKNKEYEEFIELALDFLGDYPNSSWVVDKIEEVKELIYGDLYDRTLQRMSWLLERRMEKTNSLVMVSIYFCTFILCLAIFAFVVILVIPFWIVKVCLLHDSVHMRRLRTDSLYRRISEAQDIVDTSENDILLVLKDVANSKSILLVEENRFILAQDVIGSMKSMRNRSDLQNLKKKVEKPFSEIVKLTISDTEIKIFDKESLPFALEDFVFRSLEVPRQLKDYLEKTGWEYQGAKPQSILIILRNSLWLFFMAALFGYWGEHSEWNEYLTFYICSALFVNGAVYAYFRLRERMTIETFTPPEKESKKAGV
jgi:tetratricopeptide (TPR) repeat protein